jgi:anti-anti-sigma factor
MENEFVHQENVSVHFPEGRLDHSQAFMFESQMNALINQGVNRIILDLSKLDYISSSGIRIFISIIRQLNDKQGRIAFCSIPSSISNIIEMVSLQDDLEIFPTLFDALLSFDPKPLSD